MQSPHSLPQPADDWALFLDVDGTLLEIADAPDAVAVDPRLRAILSALAGRFDGALALVSGRRLATLDRFFDPLKLNAAGLHGLERRDASGAVHRAEISAAALAGAKSAMRGFAMIDRRLLVEDKDLAVGLHYRAAPELEPQCEAFAAALSARLGADMVLQRGKMVRELRPRGPDKGDVVRAFMNEAPFHRRRPVFIGDDVTDENAFRAVNAENGHSIRVGSAAGSAAKWHVGSVDALRGWLSGIAGLTFFGDDGGDGDQIARQRLDGTP